MRSLMFFNLVKSIYSLGNLKLSSTKKTSLSIFPFKILSKNNTLSKSKHLILTLKSTYSQL